jgi:predicted lipoprotein with Yx(FWY)xxD motif
MSRTRTVISATFAVIGMGVLGACGLGAGDAGSVKPVAVQQQQQAPVAAPAKLVAAEVGSLGQVLTDENGMTLYRFAKDAAKPPKSNCDNSCATAWPPLLSDAPAEVTGVEASLVGTVIRTDGKKQVTVNGWPVYRFAKDTAPGKALGQGVDGNWAAVTPTGAKAEEKAASVNVTEIDGLGQVLADQNGMTLYLFTKDTKKPSKSNCDGDCATKWPPLRTTNGDTQVNGVNPNLVGKVTRSDGTEQVTVGGWPVYTFANDVKPGDAKGHGVGGTWFEIEPAGCKISAGKEPTKTAAETSAPPAGAPSNTTGGY